MVSGIILIIIGIGFLLQNLGYISGSVWNIIWPIILIVLGLNLIFRQKRIGFFWEEKFDWRKNKFPSVADQPRAGKIKKKYE